MTRPNWRPVRTAIGRGVTVPNLFLVGAPRCGTTSLYRYLAAHEEIFMSPVKEPHFLGSDPYDPTSLRDESRSRALFEHAGGARVAGEASVWYLYSQTAAKQIRDFSPDARILILLRNSVDMVLSLHTHHV